MEVEVEMGEPMTDHDVAVHGFAGKCRVRAVFVRFNP